jgi:periplasmic protein TonB
MTDHWEDDLAPRARPRKKPSWLPRIAIGLGLCSFVGVVAWSAYALMTDKKTTKRQVVQISLLKPPPPPPPPPEVKPPEPQVKDEVKMPEPEQPKQADEALPASEQLGLDSEGSGNGDGFGLAAKKGGRDITTIGGGGGGDRSQFAWFTGLVQNELQEQFQKNNKLRSADYKVVLRVWFGHDGRLDHYELTGSSGNPDIDKNLKLSLDEMPRLKQAPPESMPQPLKLRVTSRGAG